MVEAKEHQVNRKYNSGTFGLRTGSVVKSERNFCPPGLLIPHHSVLRFEGGIEVGTCKHCGYRREIASDFTGDRFSNGTFDGTIRDKAGIQSTLERIVRQAGPISSSYD